MKTKLETYALELCFLAVICIVISVGMASYSLISVFSPELTMETETYNMYQSNNSYWESLRSSCGDSDNENNKNLAKEVKPAEEELTRQRLEAFSIAVKNEKRDCIQSITQELIYILTAVITLAVSWKIAKNSQEIQKASP